MGSLRNLRAERDLAQCGGQQPFINTEPRLPDLSAAATQLRLYGLDLTRYRINRALEITDLDTSTIYYRLRSVRFTSRENVEITFHQSRSAIQSILDDLVGQGAIMCVDDVDPDGFERPGYALRRPNSLTPEQQHVLQALWRADDGLSLQEIKNWTGFPMSFVQAILEEELVPEGRVSDSRCGKTRIWRVVV
jgi:hypothetical protein